MTCTANYLIAIGQQAVKEGWKYVYGAKKQKLTVAQIQALRRMYGSNAVWPSDDAKAGHICCDCSGLISAATGIIRGSAQYYSTAIERVPISKRSSKHRGWAVWMKGHIGIYDGDGGYYAMDGSARNAVHYPLSKNKFTHLLKLCDVDYSGSSATPAPAVKPQPSGGSYNSAVQFTYAVRIEGGKILPSVTNLADYAGIRGKKITDVAIWCDKGAVKYRVHVLGGNWLPWVTKHDWQDDENGYAGIGKPIDLIQVSHSGVNGQKAQYRVAPVRKNYYPWQFNTETAGGQDGYAGTVGVAIDRFQLF